MVAVVGNLPHDVLTDVVGLLWVVSYVGFLEMEAANLIVEGH